MVWASVGSAGGIKCAVMESCAFDVEVEGVFLSPPSNDLRGAGVSTGDAVAEVHGAHS